MNSLFNKSISWVLYLVFIIISYMIAKSSSDVFVACPMRNDEEIDVNAQSMSAITYIFTSFSIIALLACIGFTRTFTTIPEIVKKTLESNQTSWDMLVSATGILFIIFTVVAVIFSAICEFSGIEAANNCNVLSFGAEEKEKVDEYVSSVTTLNRLWSLVVLFIILVSLGVAYLVGGKIKEAVESRNVTKLWSQFGKKSLKGARGRKMRH